MNILFRVDAGGQVGLGHFFRSLTLANYLSSKGFNISYCYLRSDFWDSIIAEGFEFNSFQIDPDHETTQLKNEITRRKINVFYVDGIIEFTKKNIHLIKENCTLIFYQNLSKSKNFADVFILPSLHQSSDFFESFDKKTFIYRGLEYLIFNQNILTIKPVKVSKQVNSIGILAGGSDPKNALLRLYDLIQFKRYPSITFQFFYGKDYLFMNNLPDKTRSNVQFLQFDHTSISNCDILISAFGVSTYEFMSLGLPTISFGHQTSNSYASDYLAKYTNSIISLGLIDHITSQRINIELDNLINNFAHRVQLNKNSINLVKREGHVRVGEIIATNDSRKR